MSADYNQEEIEMIIEEIKDELEHKVVKEICKKLNLSSEYETMTIRELQQALGVPLGFCHIIWNTKQEILKREYGINWKSLADLNPDVYFD